MTETRSEGELLASVDVNELDTVRSRLIREFFPHFVEEMELGRFVRELLSGEQCTAVRIERHTEADGGLSRHVFDVYRLS